MKIKDEDAIMLGIQASLSPAFLDPLTADEDDCWYPEIEEKLSNFLELPKDYDTTQLFMEANRFLECFIEVVLKAETELFLRSYETHCVVRNRIYAFKKEYIEPLLGKLRIKEEIEREFDRIDKSYATERIRIELAKYCDKNIESFNKICPAAAKAIQEKRYQDIAACFNDYRVTVVQELCDALCEVKEDVLKLSELYCPKLKNRHSASKMLPGSWLELKIQRIQERLQFSRAKSVGDRVLLQFETLLFIAYAIAKHIHFRDVVFINSFSTTTDFLVEFFKGGIPNKDAIMNAQDNLEEAYNKILCTLVNVERDLYSLSVELRFVPKYADLPEDILGFIQKMNDTLTEVKAQGGKIEQGVQEVKQEIKDNVEPKEEEKWVTAEELEKIIPRSARSIKMALYILGVESKTGGLYSKKEALAAWNNQPKMGNIRKEYEKKKKEKRAAKVKPTAAIAKKKRGPARK